MILSYYRTRQKLFLNKEAIAYAHPFSELEDSGTEVALFNGTILHVSENFDEVMNKAKEAVSFPTQRKTGQGPADGKLVVVNGKLYENGKNAVDGEYYELSATS